MTPDSFEYLQYDSCVSRGICSLNPRISALQTVLVLFLRIFAIHAKDIETSENCKNFILNTLAIAILNPEFNEKSFLFAIERFKKELPEIIDKYQERFPNNNIQEERDKAIELLKESSNVIQAIKHGEKIFRRGVESLSTEIRDLYNIMLVIAKSISINLLELKSFGKDSESGYKTILNLLSQINITQNNKSDLVDKIIKASEIDNNIMELVRKSQEERYGIQFENEVSFSTTPGKAILVVGSNIRELETILEALKEQDIDVYTHDEMMLAHTFPKFKEYERLRGQFGQGLENCLLDFATFPGPIVLTKHSLHNIENFYRGQLFTTDYTSTPKGIIKIENNDFSTLIEATNKSKGFKRGKQCESISIGYSYDLICNQIKEKLNSNSYEQIIIIGIDNNSIEQKSYFEKLIKLIPQNILIISFFYYQEKENLIHINTCFDNYSLTKIVEFIKKQNIYTTIFLPKCERSSISQMIYYSQTKNTQVYVGKCAPIILNPSLMNTLQSNFNIQTITTSKKDLENIII